MGIDHGLGGKDSQKSKEKRQKRAAKQKIVARKALTGGKKKEILFDDAARVEFLTGFRKRKQERRKFGLTMQILKEKKELKDRKKEKIAAHKKAMNLNSGRKSTADDSEEAKKSENVKVAVFDDNHTQNMFGGVVSIEINEGISLS